MAELLPLCAETVLSILEDSLLLSDGTEAVVRVDNESNKSGVDHQFS